MIRKRTVFILGAGASYEYGFPLGSQLRSAIINLALNEPCPDDATPVIKEVWHLLLEDRRRLSMTEWDEKSLVRFARRFMQSGTYSIDTYLSHRREDRPMGAALIGLIISRCERLDLLFRHPRLYSWLADRMGSMSREPSNNAVTFITFNYDRSLECYLASSVLAQTRKYDEANKVLESVDVIHMHGSVGALPSFAAHTSENIATQPYRGWSVDDQPAEYNHIDVERWQQALRLVGERSAPQQQAIHQQARDAIAQAQVVCFLGFGYDKDNMKLLGFPYTPGTLQNPKFVYQGKHVKENPIVLGAALGLSASRRREVCWMLYRRQMTDDDPKLLRFNLHRTCTELLDDNIQTLDAEWDLPKP